MKTENNNAERSEIQNEIFAALVRLSNKAKRLERHFLTCPKCKTYPVDIWVIVERPPYELGASVRKCKKCGWEKQNRRVRR